MPFPILLSLSLLTILLYPTYYASAYQSSSSAVLELQHVTTIDSYIKSSHEKPLLLQFYAPWCSHCHRFAPIYEHVASELQHEAHVARINGAKHRVASLRFRITGFPSFYLIHDGTVTQFVGERSADTLTQFVTSRGASFGNKINYFGGPTSPYWSAVSTVFWIVDLATRRVTHYQQSGGSLLLLVVSIIIGVVSAFILVIYIITSPSKYTAQPTQTHPHAQ